MRDRISLKLWEAIAITACMVVALLIAFFFGYRSGHSIGYDYALTTTLSNTARYTVLDEPVPELDSKSVEDIYARLSDEELEEKDEVEEEEVPKLAPIKTEKVIVEDKESKAKEIKKTKEAEEKILANIHEPEETLEVIADLDEIEVKSEKPKTPEVEVVTEQPIKKKEVKVEQANLKQEPVKELKKEIEESKKVEEVVEVKKEVEKEKSVEAVVDSGLNKYFARTVKQGWYAQVSAPRDKALAAKLANTLYQSGFPSQIETVKMGDNIYYRVLVGPEASRPYAERLIEQLKREKYLPGSPFVKQVR